MANTQDNLAAAGKIQEAAQRVETAKQKATAAKDAVDSAHAGTSTATDEEKRAANEELAKANAELTRAEQSLQQEIEHLGAQSRPKPQDRNEEKRQKVIPKWRAHVRGLLAVLALLGLLAALFLLALTVWMAGANTIISDRSINVWFGLSALTIVLCLLTTIIVLHRMTQGRGGPSVWVVASGTIPVSRVREAAQRVEEAKQKATTAQGRVDSAQKAVTDASQEHKAAAEEELANAKADLAAAKDILQFEQKQFEFMMHGQSQYLGAGTLQYLVFGILALVVLIFLMYGIFNGVLLPSLASLTVSRGLITFLIAVVTVTIALILVLAIVVSESNEKDQRFVQGKEILTMLIGVLGTIVGFYFGNSADGTKSLQISPPFVSKESPVGGETIDLSSFISGGKAPFSIEVTFTPDIIDAVKEAQSADGTIKLPGLKTKTVEKDTRVSYQIKVRDSEGRIGLYDSGAAGKDLEVKLKPKQ